MNKTETRMADWLEVRRCSGEIVGWWFEPVSIRLADGLRYRPDFMVCHPDRSIEYIEVKGAFIRDRALVKPKAAAALFPFWKFTLAQWAKGTWTTRVLLP